MPGNLHESLSGASGNMNVLYIARLKQNGGVEEGAWHLAWLLFRTRLAMQRETRMIFSIVEIRILYRKCNILTFKT